MRMEDLLYRHSDSKSRVGSGVLCETKVFFFVVGGGGGAGGAVKGLEILEYVGMYRLSL